MRNYRITGITTRPRVEISELRAMTARLLPTLTWRHHAIGALQGYVAEDREPEVRVHIWHPDLVRCDPGRDGGRIHDHRFDLRSTVLAGSIGHEEIHVDDEADGDWTEYTVQHARKGAAPLTPTGRRLRVWRDTMTIDAGCTYDYPTRSFHRSFVPGLAVTLVTKLSQRSDPARVLFPCGVEPTFGVHPFDPSEASRYVAMATEALVSRGA